MRVIHKLTLKPIVIALSLLQSSTLTNASIGLESAAPWTNRFTGQGLTGDHQLGGFIDDMFPILGNNNDLLYVDGSLAAAQEDAWLASAGTGARLLRTIGSRQVIVGAFVFGEYQHTPDGAEAWYANPGFELMTNHQEFRVQGYIPLTKRIKGYANIMASQLPQSVLNETKRDQSKFAFATGHSFFDTNVELADSFGTGLDAEVGQYLPVALGGWVRAGVYHFDYDNSSSINGVEANLQLFTGKHASIIVQDNYDNQNKNKVMVGVQMTFGGPNSTQVEELSNRMEEPIIRHIARPSYALVTPIRHDFIPSGSSVPMPVTTQNWFFSEKSGTQQGGTISFENCTAENPCYDLTQDIADGIQLIQPAANLMFSSGTYTLEPNPTNQLNGAHPQAVIMSDGQTIIGKTGPSGTRAQWSKTATGDNRPIINGALFWGNNNNGITPVSASGTLENMQVRNHDQLIPQFVSGYTPAGATTAAAIAVGATNNLTISHSTTDTLSSTNGAQAIGLFSLNGNIMADHIFIGTNTSGAGIPGTDNYNALGILAQNGQIVVSDADIFATTQGNSALAYGVTASKNITLTRSLINTSTSGVGANGIGVLSTQQNVTLTSSTVEIITTGQNSNATAVSVPLGNVSVTGSSIKATTVGVNSQSVGIHASAPNHIVTMASSTLASRSIGSGSFAYGIIADIVNFTGTPSSITATAPSGATAIAGATVTPTVHNTNNSQCTTNGNTVTCA